jgi:hypothetical protein
MEAEDTEAIKKLVEAGFGASILPEKALQHFSSTKDFQDPRYTTLSGNCICYACKCSPPPTHHGHF